MNNIIEKMKTPTYSNNLIDFLNQLGLKTHIIQEEELPNKEIDEILKNGCCILFEKNDNSNIGHWTSLIEHPEKNIIEYFDSYGRTPLRLKGYKVFFNKYNKLYNMVYNPYIFQKNIDSAACGRHVVLRLLFKDYQIDTYKKFMDDDGIDDDFMATLYTNRF